MARSAVRFFRVIAAISAIAIAGCAGDNKQSASFGAPRGATVAFESINGPPDGVFRKLVELLNEEAQSRQLAVVSRNNPSVYRVRGFLTAQRERGKIAVSWIWDVYDAQQRRALRITGAESVPAKSRDIWTATDNEMLKRIARACMDQLATFLTSPEAAPPAAPTGAPAENGNFAVAGSPNSTPAAFSSRR